MCESRCSMCLLSFILVCLHPGGGGGVPVAAKVCKYTTGQPWRLRCTSNVQDRCS
jgi:hypothetical protein